MRTDQPALQHLRRRSKRTRRLVIAGLVGAALLTACHGPAATQEITLRLTCATYWGGDVVTDAGEHPFTVTVSAPTWTDESEEIVIRIDALNGYFGEPGEPYAMSLGFEGTSLSVPSLLEFDDPATGHLFPEPTIKARITGDAGTDATVEGDRVHIRKVGQWESARTVCNRVSGTTGRIATIPIRARNAG